MPRWLCSLLTLLLLGGHACQKSPDTIDFGPPAVGFYHWQQRLTLDSLPPQLLATEVPLYTRFFDVIWSHEQPDAASIVSFDSIKADKSILPVVFITNEVMKFSSPAQRKKLAEDLLALVDTLYLDYHSPLRARVKSSKANKMPQHVPYVGLQIDCDWTVSTRAAYFDFLRRLAALLPMDTELSVTIRMHQYRDTESQGIPPVKRGTLMAYNVGDLNDWDTENSQLDSNIIAAYLKRPVEDSYPIQLDLALPLYEWGCVYRDGELVYLVNELNTTDLTDSSRFEALATHRYRVRQNTYLRGYFLYAGDLIRLEGPREELLKSVYEQLRQVPAFAGQRLLYYRIGSEAARNIGVDLLVPGW